MTHVAPSKDSAPREAIQSVNDAGNVKASSSNWNDSVNNNEHMSEHSRELEVRSARDKIETPNANNVMHIDADHKNPLCVGEAHWVALLNEVAEVRSYLQTQQQQYEKQTERIAHLLKRTSDDPGPALLFGTSKVLGRAEILTQIPSRYTCDLMVARYFRTLDPALHILHAPLFRKQYTEHWNNRSQTSIVWVALLFAIMRIVVLSWLREGDEPPEFQGKCHDLAISFRTRVADCLILADYTLPHEHLIESLILHLYGEYASRQEINSSVWVLNGLIIRLAMRMGYHRDPQHLPNVSPFQGEMRRRVWAFICQADLLFSFQAGLPSMIKISKSDENFPRNIHDDANFHEGCTELSRARPDSETTPISYLIAKTRLAFAFSGALEEVNRTDTKLPYDRVLAIDKELRQTYDNIPEHFKLRAMSEQLLDPVPLIAARFTLANIHHKSLCVVHSRFLEAARINDRYSYSRRVCLESAMTLLSFQAIQHQEFTGDGNKRSLAKYQTSLTTHDFLLAATIVCAELFLDQGWGGFAYRTRAGPTREELTVALDRSADIWSKMRDQSIEAYKASDILGMLLKRLQNEDTQKTESIRRGQPHGANMNAAVIEPREGVQDLEPMYTGFEFMNNAGNYSCPSLQNLPAKPDSMPAANMMSGGFNTNFANGTRVMNPSRYPVGMSTADSRLQQFDQEWDMWDAYVPTLDLSDPVSTLWSLNSGYS